MADLIRKVAYFKTQTPNRAGEGARILGVLKGAGVNLFAFTGFPRGRRAQMDFIPENAAAFKKAAKKAGLKVGAQKTGFLVQGEDRKGAVAGVMEKLAKARINLTAMDAVSAGKGRYGAIFWVKPKDAAKAAKTLGAS